MTNLDDGADLRAVMDRSLRDLQVPDHCGPAALASGRRIRTRRRATAALAGVATVAAVAALTLPALGGSGGPSSQFADDPTSEPSDLPETRAVEGWWDIPATRMAELLEQKLPDGVTIENVDTTQEGVPAGSDDEMTGGLLGTLSASTGPGAFQIILYTPEVVEEADGGLGRRHLDAVAGHAEQRPDDLRRRRRRRGDDLSSNSNANRIKCRAYMKDCERILDGSSEQVGRLTTDVESGTTYYEAVLLGPDGGALYFYVANSTGEKPGYEAPTAEVPPLTLEQLRTLAEDPVWTSYRP